MGAGARTGRLTHNAGCVVLKLAVDEVLVCPFNLPAVSQRVLRRFNVARRIQYRSSAIISPYRRGLDFGEGPWSAESRTHLAARDAG